MKRQIYLASFVLLGLAAIIVLVIRIDGKQVGNSTATQGPIQALRIQRPDFPEIALSFTDNQWQITEPCELAANPQRLQPLLDALAVDAHQYDAAEVDLDAAGLLKPNAIVMLGDTRIEIGNTDLQGDRRYIRRGNAVQFVPEWILSLINGGLSAMASTAVFAAPISSLAVVTDTQLIELNEQDIQQWQSLNANQIVPWPINKPEKLLATRTLELRHGEGKSTLDVHTYPRYSVVHIDNAGCAYILATDSLPPLPEH